MEVIVHIGTPKSGTTALQVAMSRNREKLRENGVIYPKGILKGINHVGIALALRSPSRLPRSTPSRYVNNYQLSQNDYDLFFKNLKEQVAQENPRAVIISAESFWNTRNLKQTERFAATLREIGDFIHVVAYVRDPADFFLSHTQQRLKASYRMPEVGARFHKRNLTEYMKVADKVTVSAFERRKLVNQDISTDFFSNLFPDHSVLSKLESPRAANETISAEAMDILQTHRKECYPDRQDVITDASKAFLKNLIKTDREVDGFERPKLFPHVREAAISQAKDLLWLRDTFGTEFEKVDYSKLPMTPHKPWRPERVDQICYFDAARRDQLRERLEATISV